jgi:hypothetical protein
MRREGWRARRGRARRSPGCTERTSRSAPRCMAANERVVGDRGVGTVRCADTPGKLPVGAPVGHTPVFADSHLALCLGPTVIAAAVSTRPSRPEVRLSRTRGSTRHLPLAPQCRPGALARPMQGLGQPCVQCRICRRLPESRRRPHPLYASDTRHPTLDSRLSTLDPTRSTLATGSLGTCLLPVVADCLSPAA